MLLNGYHYMEPVTEVVKAGTTETWRWVNLTVDAHPMHMHLVTFQVVNRQQIDVAELHRRVARVPRLGPEPVAQARSRRLPGREPMLAPAPEEMGFKDTAKVPPGYVTRTRAKFTLPWTSALDYKLKTRSYGTWVYHCHILEHEENDMMRPFEVVK